MVKALEAALATMDFWAEMGVNIDDTWNAREKVRKAIDRAEEDQKDGPSESTGNV